MSAPFTIPLRSQIIMETIYIILLGLLVVFLFGPVSWTLPFELVRLILSSSQRGFYDERHVPQPE